MKQKSVDRVRRALLDSGHSETILEFPEGTKSAVDAANAVGCGVAQIVKSMIFRCGENAVLVLTSGANQVEVEKVSKLVGSEITSADGRWVREVTGFAIGGVAPIGHLSAPIVFIDEDLMGFDKVWAAAGSPMKVFSTTGQKLVEMTNGAVVNIKATR